MALEHQASYRWALALAPNVGSKGAAMMRGISISHRWRRVRMGLATGLFCVAVMNVLASCGGSGDGGSGGSGSNPPAATSRLAYAANWSTGNVSTFGVNPDGSVTALLPPTAAGQHPHTINVDPAGRFVYVSNHE